MLVVCSEVSVMTDIINRLSQTKLKSEYRRLFAAGFLLAFATRPLLALVVEFSGSKLFASNEFCNYFILYIFIYALYIYIYISYYYCIHTHIYIYNKYI